MSKGCVVCIIATVNTTGSIGILPVIIILVPYTWNNNSKIDYFTYSNVSREGLAPIVKAYSRLIPVDGLVL